MAIGLNIQFNSTQFNSMERTHKKEMELQFNPMEMETTHKNKMELQLNPMG